MTISLGCWIKAWLGAQPPKLKIESNAAVMLDLLKASFPFLQMILRGSISVDQYVEGS
jgi:hypothetical protein